MVEVVEIADDRDKTWLVELYLTSEDGKVKCINDEYIQQGYAIKNLDLFSKYSVAILFSVTYEFSKLKMSLTTLNGRE